MIPEKPVVGLDPRMETSFLNPGGGQRRRNFALAVRFSASAI
jgi:hypothetical protein